MFLTSIQMRVSIGHLTFSTQRKGSPYVYVLSNTRNDFRTLPRAEAEALYRSLRKKGFQPHEPLAHKERANRGLGNYVFATT